jgi:hypothetical protein
MAYPKASGAKKTYRLSQVLPIWSQANTAAATLLFQELLEKLGVTDVRSYFQHWRIPIVIGVVVCACMGAASDGIKGLAIGGLLGVVAPIALLWAGVMLALVVLYLALFAGFWAALFAIAGWLLE